MSSKPPLELTLRPREKLPAGLAPAGLLRDRQAEKLRAIANATKKALAAAPPELKLEYTAARRGDATPAYAALAAGSILPITQKLPAASIEKASHRQRRLAIASRWHKARLLLGPATEVQTASPAQGLAQMADTRQVRRGEFKGLTPHPPVHDIQSTGSMSCGVLQVVP